MEPFGCRVARYYCPLGRTTFSLLPDFLAAGLSSTLQEVEQAVAAVEEAPSVEAAAASLRPDITLTAAVRWTRRRLGPCRAAMLAIATLFPGRFSPTTPTITSMHAQLQRPDALVSLREIAAEHLQALPRPLGFGRRFKPRGKPQKTIQHNPGPDSRAGPG